MKKIFSTMVVAAALFVGYSTYNAQNSNELSDVALANVEALSKEVDKTEGYYFIQKYAICSMLEVTSVSGDIAGEISVGAIITKLSLSELKGKLSGEIQCRTVDCHWRKCLATTEAQKIACIEGEDWEKCHSQCNHSNNQI